MGEPAGTGNTAPTLTTVTVLVLLWALISFFIRLYVKLKKSDVWGGDDIAISVSAVRIIVAASFKSGR